jgi:hypothetical protein
MRTRWCLFVFEHTLVSSLNVLDTQFTHVCCIYLKNISSREETPPPLNTFFKE